MKKQNCYFKTLDLHQEFFIWYFCSMKKTFFKLLASLNKLLLPSYSKKHLDMTKASKLQLALIGWRYLVTKNAID